MRDHFKQKSEQLQTLLSTQGQPQIFDETAQGTLDPFHHTLDPIASLNLNLSFRQFYNLHPDVQAEIVAKVHMHAPRRIDNAASPEQNILPVRNANKEAQSVGQSPSQRVVPVVRNPSSLLANQPVPSDVNSRKRAHHHVELKSHRATRRGSKRQQRKRPVAIQPQLQRDSFPRETQNNYTSGQSYGHPTPRGYPLSHYEASGGSHPHNQGPYYPSTQYTPPFTNEAFTPVFGPPMATQNLYYEGVSGPFPYNNFLPQYNFPPPTFVLQPSTNSSVTGIAQNSIESQYPNTTASGFESISRNPAA